MSLATLQYSADDIMRKRGEVRQRMLSESPHIRQPNFISISTHDLLVLYRAYDAVFFAGQLNPLVMQHSLTPMQFRLSRAMISSGGKTSWHRRAGKTVHFEIGISTSLLFISFRQDTRPIHVAGQLCTDRLDALMRIMEHELVHLLEMLNFGNSSCGKTRFMTIAQRLFGHTHAKHRLVTAREHAAAEHGIRVGQRVRFAFEGKEHIGIVNRVGLRATVLVPDSQGMRFSDGRRYTKFLIPPARLTLVSLQPQRRPAGGNAQCDDRDDRSGAEACRHGA